MLTNSRHPDLTEALEEMQLAEPDYVEASDFYNGTVDEVLASQKLRELFGNQGSKFRINYARTPVDCLLERTKIQGFTCKDTGQLAAIEATWFDNELGIEAKDVHRRAYEFGDAYLVAWPEDDDPDFPGKVSAYAHDPTHVRVFYDPERPRKKRLAVHKWLETGTGFDGNQLPKGEVYQRVNLYYPDRLEKWVSKEAVLSAAGHRNMIRFDSEYEEFGDVEDGEQWPIPNPVPDIIPVFHFRTGRPYGRPEHADAYGPQYAINKLLLSLMGAVDHAVLPQRYVTTESAMSGQTSALDAFDTAVGEIDTEVNDDGLDPSSTMETGPGNVWLLSGKSVKPGQFAAADSENFIEPMESLVRQMADVTDLPANRYHSGGQQPSGDSQRMSERPLNDKVDDRHAQFGVTWHEFFSYVCEVNGLGATDAQVNWAPPDIATDKDSWETAQLQLKAGVPFDQVMRERGYGSEKIEEWAPYAEGVVASLVNRLTAAGTVSASGGDPAP